jgi:hypothetical protein
MRLHLRSLKEQLKKYSMEEVRDKTKVKYITVNRYAYSDTTTVGRMIAEGHGVVAHTLEDTARATGVKIKGKTAIPETPIGYKCAIHRSNKFNRDVIILYNNPNGVTLEQGGIKFNNIYIHGGNNHTNTEGCILVGENVNLKDMTIQGTAEVKVFNIIRTWMAKGYDVKCLVINNQYTDVP